MKYLKERIEAEKHSHFSEQQKAKLIEMKDEIKITDKNITVLVKEGEELKRCIK